ncbi:MAG: DegT/DnrJ/EryC1/StrS family aminotransferase [Gammaproteobacteria bacterium]
MINISVPFISKQNQEDVMHALIKESVSTYGIEVNDFEEAISKKCKTKYVVAVNSGTSALELTARMLLRDGNDFESNPIVAVSDYTFIATSNAILNTGLGVCPIPCLETNYAMCPKALKNEIEARQSQSKKKLSGVFVTLPGGNLVSTLSELANICESYDLPLIIDAASSIAINFNELYKLCPNVAAITLSFNGNKVITSGAGGAILTNLGHFADKVRTHISLHRVSKYDHIGVGENKKMPALTAALGLSQLQELDWRMSARKKIFDTYASLLKDTKLGDIFRFSIDDTVISPSFWIAGLIPRDYEDKQLIERSRHLLNELDIASPPFWKLLSDQADYSKFLNLPIYVKPKPLPDYLQLPSHFSLDLDLITLKIKEFEEKL